ncbi:TetR/AcrR family transcriptional regulator C-terminal domain-containing protein [Streptomyces sp. NPDC048278]|uniref:TetR/AcrR family transcriptional regulator n=1 Tax=Streptomyces sp. NPDC048278 TaxID=3155809 RepID=UPI003416E3AC
MPVQPSDPRIRRSRTALEAALRELVVDHELSQISVSDLTKHAGVNRSTFYEHYTDVHDLAAAACTAVFDQLVTAVQSAGPSTLSDGAAEQSPLGKVFTHVAENSALYRALLGDDGSARVINHLLRRMIVANRVSRVAAGMTACADDEADRVPHDPAAAFLAGATLGVIADWLHHGCPGTPEEMGTVLEKLLTTSSVAYDSLGARESPGVPLI